MNDLVASGVDGIAISPIDAENQTDFLNHRHQTLLVCADSDAEKSKRACYIGTDNVAAGTQAADLLKAACPKAAKSFYSSAIRTRKTRKTAFKASKMYWPGQTSRSSTRWRMTPKAPLRSKNAQDALAKYPDLAGMVGLYSYDGPAILTAVAARARPGR